MTLNPLIFLSLPYKCWGVCVCVCVRAIVCAQLPMVILERLSVLPASIGFTLAVNPRIQGEKPEMCHLFIIYCETDDLSNKGSSNLIVLPKPKVGPGCSFNL